MNTNYGEISSSMVSNYLNALINRFYKILPIKESGEATLGQYIESLIREMIGMQKLMDFLHHDDRYMTLLAILQYFTDHDTDVAAVKTEVFRAIGILKKLQAKYCSDKG